MTHDMQTPYRVYFFSGSQLTDPLWPSKTNTSEDYMHNAQSMSCDDMLMICVGLSCGEMLE